MNGAKVRGLWTLGKATIDQVKRNREYLKQFSNPEFAHRDLILEGENVKYEPVGASIRDMEFGALRRFNRDEILAVYGVPPSMVSIIETGNIGSGSGESQQQNFREETVIPQQQRVGERWTQKVILEGFGFRDWELKLDTPEIIGETAQAEIDVQYITAGVLTPAEVKQLRFSGEPIMVDDSPGASADAATDPFAMAIEKAKRKRKIRPGALGVYAKQETEIVKLANEVQVAIEKELQRQVAALASAYRSRVHTAVGKALEANMKGKPMEIRFVKVRRGLLVWKRHTWPTFLKGVAELEAALAEALDPKALQAIFEDHYRAVAGAAAKSAAGKVGGSPEAAARFLRMAEEVAAELSGYILGQLADGARTVIVEGIQEGASEGAIQSRLSEIDSFPVEVSRPGAAAHTREQTFATSAEVIARTDTNRFYNTVTAEYYKDAGVVKVRWIAAANPDPVCAVYKDKVYALDEVPDGGPPVHHNCRCALEPVLE
jgi:SPP1 gp7 family putative phage head morphogenesis protein